MCQAVMFKTVSGQAFNNIYETDGAALLFGLGRYLLLKRMDHYENETD